jgi:prolyl-tRNA synthetase
MMGDGKALQSGTSHNLADHFARGFDIQFLDRDNERKYAFTTSWGLSTRTVGAVIMVHGDSAGLILPPKIAPYQTVFVPIWRKDEERTQVEDAVQRLHDALLAAGVRSFVDWRDDKTAGWKFNEWELRGVPLRIEVGPRDVREGKAMVVRRDTRAKEAIAQDELTTRVQGLLEQIQHDLFERAKQFRAENTRWATDYDTFKQEIEQRGFINAWWCGDAACEEQVKNETKATIRCLPLDQQTGSTPQPAVCLVCRKPAERWGVFARSY